MVHEPVAYFNEFDLGDRQTDKRCKARRNYFVTQHSRLLRVVHELDYVEVPVGTQHQVWLRSTSHRTDMVYRGDHREAGLQYIGTNAQPEPCSSLRPGGSAALVGL